MPGFLVLALMVVAGCATEPSATPLTELTSTPAASSSTPTSTAISSPGEPPTWIEPADYTFVLESGCGERSLIGRFRVRVDDHRTVEIERLDQAAQVFPGTAEDVPTLKALVALASGAMRGGADIVNVTLDPVDGHPALIEIDWRVAAIDDEACYAISEYVPG